MPEQRARTYHRNRVASTFSEEIGAMLEGELSDPRIAPGYVTDVVLAPGGKSARVFVAVHGSEAEEASTLAGLMAARGFIRSTCATAWAFATSPSSPSPSTAPKG
jgi:ribosome-binding factor A